MLPIVLIFLALAIIFIILIRRLPKALELSETERQRPKPVAGTPGWLDLDWLGTVIEGFLARSIKRLPKIRVKVALPRPTFWSADRHADRLVEGSRKPVIEKRAETVPAREDRVVPQLNELSMPIAETPEVRPVFESKPPLPTKANKNVALEPHERLLVEADDAFELRDYRKAERLYLKLATLQPKNPLIYTRLGIIYLTDENFVDARDAFQQAIKLDPTLATRHYNLALAYVELGSNTKAINSLEQALKYDPSNRKYRKMLDHLQGKRSFERN
ncbi:MAG: Tfp pilus assembly protein PilF [Candidatus Berkelbacteria bacterium Gr01-1014_85]|uniref:Tfp pilus assembly protein PilF n=1 Tax=Candidatus Berkelbacteria bacterium Gr01-1014_85 TaxID=2017150 RepID=A0A554J9G6_9BACT|nr:MAG: Tfp pilus assembly protein PilF [Candidatus Berkelbacteria bacterium Gr01-1014_85]